MKKIFILSIGFLTLSCKKENGKEEFKKETMNTVSFEIPKSWKKAAVEGVDSAVRVYITPNSDTIVAEYGSHNNPFDDSRVIVVDDSIAYKTLKKDNSSGERIMMTIDKELDYKQGIFLDNYYYYDTISHHLAKVMLPKRNMMGQMGVYFGNVDHDKNKFSIYTYQPLKGKDSLNFFRMMKSIQIQ